MTISRNAKTCHRWVQHAPNFVEKTFVGGSKSTKFVNVFSLENFRYTIHSCAYYTLHSQTIQAHWSFVAGHDEVVSGSRTYPCNAGHSLEGLTIDAAIGQDHFCDTGSETGALHHRFYHDDPLWDGVGCGPRSACCSFNSPP